MTLFHASTMGYVVGFWDVDGFHVEGWEPTVQDAQVSAECVVGETCVVYALVPLSAFGGTPGADHA